MMACDKQPIDMHEATIISTKMTTTMTASSLFYLFLCASVLLTLSFEPTCAFQPPQFPRTSSSLYQTAADASSLSTSQSTDNDTATTNIKSIKKSLENLMAPTNRGRSTTPTQQDEIETHVQQLESLCNLEAPANSPLVQGSWIVDYTTAPPPSNGQLGPFSGIARQVVSLQDGTYRNLLSVPPNDWLTASLDATWQEWDGVYLDNPQEKNDTPHIGGSCWKVTFQNLTVRLLGVPLFAQKFQDTERIWRTTYCDDDTRIVRAGRTGRQDDEMLFYMTRESY